MARLEYLLVRSAVVDPGGLGDFRNLTPTPEIKFPPKWGYLIKLETTLYQFGTTVDISEKQLHILRTEGGLLTKIVLLTLSWASSALQVKLDLGSGWRGDN